MRQELNRPLTDSAKVKLDRVLEDARGKLTDPGAATASWMRGWAMQQEEAIRFASRSRSS
jgi:hypothetical protein